MVRKRRTRRAVKVQRSVVGISLDEIRRRKNQRPEVRAAAREAALREIKSRKGKDAKKSTTHKKRKNFDRTVVQRR